MRGQDEQQEGMFSYISPEQRVPRDHPLRRVRALVEVALKQMSPQFAELYSRYGRPSIAPEKLLRDTHESGTDPQARLYKKSRMGEARPSYLGHVLTENRNGLIVKACVTQSATRAEREAGLEMLRKIPRREEGGKRRPVTLGGDQAYQEEKFIDQLRAMQVIPHIAEYEKESRQWPNWLTSSERGDPGYAISQRKRKLVEKVFAWMKCVAGLRKTKFRKRRRVDWIFRLAAAACNLIRLAKLIPAET